MRRGRILIFVVLIIIIGLIVAFVAVRQFLVSATPSQQQPLFVDVYVAGQNIPQGQAVTEAALSTITIPQDKVVQVMFTRDELPNLLNKVAKFPLDQGVVITESMVGDASSAGLLSFPPIGSLFSPGRTSLLNPAP